MKLASLAREVSDPSATLTDVITGEYLETAVSLHMQAYALTLRFLPDSPPLSCLYSCYSGPPFSC